MNGYIFHELLNIFHELLWGGGKIERLGGEASPLHPQ